MQGTASPQTATNGRCSLGGVALRLADSPELRPLLTSNTRPRRGKPAIRTYLCPEPRTIRVSFAQRRVFRQSYIRILAYPATHWPIGPAPESGLPTLNFGSNMTSLHGSMGAKQRLFPPIKLGVKNKRAAGIRTAVPCCSSPIFSGSSQADTQFLTSST